MINHPRFNPRSAWGLATVLLVTTANAQTLYVNNNDPNCSDVTGSPFCTVQAAVDAADPHSKIEIAAGTYVENVFIDKEGLTIAGCPGEACVTTIQGTGGGVVTVWFADNVTVQDLIIQGSDGVLASNSSHCHIIDNTITGFHGIFLDSCADTNISGNVLIHSGGPSGGGIYLLDCTESSISGNVVDNQTGQQFSWGLRLVSSANNTVIGNTFNDNLVIGVYATTGSDFTIMENNITNSQSYGVYGDHVNDWTIINHYSRFNSTDGITFIEPARIEVTSCTLSNNLRGVGIIFPFDFDFMVNIHDNVEIANNTEVGILITSPDTLGAGFGYRIKGNKIDGCPVGVHVQTSITGFIENNTITNPTEAALKLSGTQDLTITNNLFYGGSYGILMLEPLWGGTPFISLDNTLRVPDREDRIIKPRG